MNKNWTQEEKKKRWDEMKESINDDFYIPASLWADVQLHASESVVLSVQTVP